MSHEPGRERHMTYACEECHRLVPLEHYTFYNGYLCEDCAHRLIKEMEEGDANDQ